MNTKISVVVAGAAGKMGREVVKAVLGEAALELVGAVDVRGRGTDAGVQAGLPPAGIEITNDLEALLKEKRPQVLVDFSNPHAVLHNIYLALDNQVCPVVGTTGLTNEEIQAIESKAEAKGIGVFIAPNFALGAVLMMKFAQEAARYFPHVEIIEMHHDQKVDAPSGTSLRTADLILEQRSVFRQGAINEYEKVTGARGAEIGGIRVHSVRLPGYVAHEEVIFGGLGQLLTLRHDSINRECFMPGVLLAINKVIHLSGLVVGLEHLLDA